ncbi:hypothetical protein DPMN_073347 [Dreissena polymorpha]|uniref:HECT domain-containing protein n=1 Tax=Dreissena polymorpha TaxID=45954 RepID=A0A9D4BYV7_DREPO|nr:hypothetical protein DPMN_073347 [Dreissena polymorpha]
MFKIPQTLAQSLHEMLDYGGEDFEDVFMQTFLISYKDVFGSTITHELRENGDSIPVTQENKRVSNNSIPVTQQNKTISNKSIPVTQPNKSIRKGNNALVSVWENWA